jgi:hypothetical protein
MAGTPSIADVLLDWIIAYDRCACTAIEIVANAWLTVSRALVSTLNALWWQGEDYRERD